MTRTINPEPGRGGRERPILFSSPMVRAILDGTKTQTRRILKPKHDYFVEDGRAYFEPYVYGEPESIEVPCPYGQAGDRLWVREAWGLHAFGDETDWERGSVSVCTEDEIRGQYKLTHRASWGPLQESCFWRPAIHMPRWASRITLKVISVRVERLHEITEEDARAEGVEPRITTRKIYPSAQAADVEHRSYRDAFAELWREINGADSWNANPWVWRVEFKRVARADEQPAQKGRP